jgi:NAD(P)-dependent dehydrogenase (short-subunit alcohol dehydrogenase family)
MLKRPGALIVEVGDGDLAGYRGQLLYDLVKSSVIRLAYAMAWDLVRTSVTALALSPGFLRSEHVLEAKGVSEANWRDAVATDPSFEQSETPFFIGRAIAALAADANLRAKSGRSLSVGELAEEYGFTDVDGRTPNFSRAWEADLETAMAAGGPPDATERFMGPARYAMIHNTPAKRDLALRLMERHRMGGLPEGLRPTQA